MLPRQQQESEGCEEKGEQSLQLEGSGRLAKGQFGQLHPQRWGLLRQGGLGVPAPSAAFGQRTPDWGLNWLHCLAARPSTLSIGQEIRVNSYLVRYANYF